MNKIIDRREEPACEVTEAYIDAVARAAITINRSETTRMTTRRKVFVIRAAVTEAIQELCTTGDNTVYLANANQWDTFEERVLEKMADETFVDQQLATYDESHEDKPPYSFGVPTGSGGYDGYLAA